MEPRYLGDGVYIQDWMNNHGLVMTTSSHELREADNTIYLEPEVVRALVKYLEEWTIEKTPK